MANKKEWNDPAMNKDNNYGIYVTTLAPMVQIEKEGIKTTGKEEQGKENSKDIKSTDLINGDIKSFKIDYDEREHE